MTPLKIHHKIIFDTLEINVFYAVENVDLILLLRQEISSKEIF